MVKQCLNIAAPAHDVKNEHVLAMDTVDNDILSDWKTSQAATQIIVARTTDMRIGGKHEKTVCDGIGKPVGDFGAAAFFSLFVPLRSLCSRNRALPIPDIVQFNLGFLREAVCHQRCRSCSASRRARPLCFTSCDRSRMD